MQLPRARDIVREEDVEAWVSAAVRAALPTINKETRDILGEQTRAMMQTLEAQSTSMQRTVELQGRTMNRLVAFGGLTAVVSYFWRDIQDTRDLDDKCRRMYRCGLVVCYSLGVLGVIRFI